MTMWEHNRAKPAPQGLASQRRTAAKAGVLLFVTLIASAGLAPASNAESGVRHWANGWSTAVTAPPPAGLPFDSWASTGFTNNTVRQKVRVSVAGPTLRIRLSNAYREQPLTITRATVARAAEGASVVPDTVRHLSFDHHEGTVIRPGSERLSDAIRFPVHAFDELTVSLYFAETTGPATTHLFANATSFLADGDHSTDAGAAAFGKTSQSWYFLRGVEVSTPKPTGTVVTFGDSLTDGSGSTLDANRRYPDVLAGRLASSGRHRTVANAGIGGNRLLADSPCFGGNAIARFHEDALDQPTARSVIVLLGINDIGFSHGNIVWPPCIEASQPVRAAELIAGYRKLIAQAHAAGIRIIGATLLPIEGSGHWTPSGEAVRDEVNTWIRTSGGFDAVVDFEAVVADPAHPDRLLPAFDVGDHLHLSDAGYAAIANSINLDQL